LISDGTIDGTKAASAPQFGTRVVRPDQFEVLLNHLQPAKPKTA
jgi:DNA polymerase-3 subunit epsilon